MHFFILLALLLLLILGPQWWVRYVLARYNRKQEAFPGTGGELARHLLDRFHLQQVNVETADGAGDHYDPKDLAVRLTADKLDGRTLTAVTTACHEVGHAIQHASGYRPFVWRQRLAGVAQVSTRGVVSRECGSVAVAPRTCLARVAKTERQRVAICLWW